MKREQKKEVIKTIESAYPNFLGKDVEKAKSKVNLWMRLLDDMVYEKVSEKLDGHIMNSPFEPKIADIAHKKPERAEGFDWNAHYELIYGENWRQIVTEQKETEEKHRRKWQDELATRTEDT